MQKFDSQGRFILAFGAKGEGSGAFTRAIGIPHDGTGNVYLTDDAVPIVQIFDNEGHFMRSFEIGRSGPVPGTSEGLNIDTLGIYVSDYDRGLVEVYTSESELLVEFGESELWAPVDIGISHDGTVLVTDQRTGLVHVYQIK